MEIQTFYMVSANDDTIRDRNSICEALICGEGTDSIEE